MREKVLKGHCIFTIGHSTHSEEEIFRLLETHHITSLVDVRSYPFSPRNPQFDRKPLHEALKRHGISYVYLGKELGARSDDPDCYQNGKVQYDRLANTELFKHGIVRVIEGMKTHRIVLMCSEKEPLQCHRTILISKELEKLDVLVLHIHDNGHTESQDEAMARLLQEEKMSENDLFLSRQELIEEACKRKEKKIAYEIEEINRPDLEFSE